MHGYCFSAQQYKGKGRDVIIYGGCVSAQLTAEYSELICKQVKSDELLHTQDELLLAALQHYQGNGRIRFDRRTQTIYYLYSETTNPGLTDKIYSRP